ncbi:M23 family metallopeptidase [Paenibacillus alkalitolerans]|uniref:M23 family metallopeptidase n=1 Tax=Paenibacillus alkalitolerans TaxID=2799335 RepID=UPI0018F5D7F7|nr:M23 family metallopeptidase [Paenibacillus alkalitolerans]
MKEDNKITPLQGEQKDSPKSSEGREAAVTGTFWKRLLAKKWVFPATYMAAAAIILALMWVYQDSANSPIPQDETGLEVSTGEKTTDGNAVPATAEAESLGWPVSNKDSLELTMEYFDVNASSEDNQAAMVEYGDTFTPHTGIDLSSPNQEPFEVLAAMGGTVTRVDQLPIAGYVVEIKHDNGLSTLYQSLDDVQVAKGDEVKKGEKIAMAGRNELEKELGVHLHFEVWKDGKPVNPETVIQ